MAATPSILQFTPSCAYAPTQGNEFNFSGLYLYHTYVGPNSTQSQIIVKDGIGTLTVNNWVIRDGLSGSSKVIARARGLHIFAGDWHNSFSLVFEDERYV
nr:DJ-variant B [Saccharum hybrid cultivar]